MFVFFVSSRLGGPHATIARPLSHFSTILNPVDHHVILRLRQAHSSPPPSAAAPPPCVLRILAPAPPPPGRNAGCPGSARGRPNTAPRAHSARRDRKSTRLNSSHVKISYAVFC